jgi:hypothetical protein
VRLEYSAVTERSNRALSSCGHSSLEMAGSYLCGDATGATGFVQPDFVLHFKQLLKALAQVRETGVGQIGECEQVDGTLGRDEASARYRGG